MPKKWTGNLVGLMHDHRITNKALAQELGVTDRYVSMVLTGHREPEGAEQKFRSAVFKIISAKAEISESKEE